MKMKDVFDLPATGVDIQGSDVYYSQTEHEQNIDNMIAHAINCHDELVDALETISRHIINMPLCDSHLYDWVEKTLQPLLVKVKGDQ